MTEAHHTANFAPGRLDNPVEDNDPLRDLVGALHLIHAAVHKLMDNGQGALR
jgi:hypothetical protein